MAASSSACWVFFPASSFSPVVSAKASHSHPVGEGLKNLGSRDIIAKSTLSSGAMGVKAQASQKSETHKAEEDSSSSARKFHKPRRLDMLADDVSGLRMITQDGLVYRQNFSIRSYEIGADGTASIVTLMNYLQETGLNHVSCVGLMDDGYGSTPEMSKRNLIWVVTKMQIRLIKYPFWEDVVEIDTWVAASGKNGMRRDWHVRDYRTGQTVMQATSVWVMMNKQTRRLSKIPEEVRSEIGSYFMDQDPILDEDSRKFRKLEANTADHVQGGLTPRWSDLDVNQHVNNVKYIGWILEGVPTTIQESHELVSMTLEYKRECGRGSVLQSLTAIVSDDDDAGDSAKPGIECQHLLRMESGPEVLRGRTEWRQKRGQDLRLNERSESN